MVGLDRDVEDLAITPRVRDLVSDARVREVLDEFDEAVPRATSHRPVKVVVPDSHQVRPRFPRRLSPSGESGLVNSA
jgi:hypothetical protein